MSGDPPEIEWAALIFLALIPIVTALGTVVAEEIRKLHERGWRIW